MQFKDINGLSIIVIMFDEPLPDSRKHKKGYIYLLQEREFVRLNEPTYKIGATTQTLAGRLSGYPKGSVIIIAFSIENCFELEDSLKLIFNYKFHKCTEYGEEYFRGDVKEMKYIISDMIMKSYNTFLNKRDEDYEINSYIKYFEDRKLMAWQNHKPSEEEKIAMEEYNKRNNL